LPLLAVLLLVATLLLKPRTSSTSFWKLLGDKKIEVIKEVRAITGLGLKEAKDLVEGAPKTVKEAAPKAEAEEIQKKLEAAGAKVRSSKTGTVVTKLPGGSITPVRNLPRQMRRQTWK
jgi:hypothetical protein